jgi:hypothetical protein
LYLVHFFIGSNSNFITRFKGYISSKASYISFIPTIVLYRPLFYAAAAAYGDVLILFVSF